MSYLIWQGWRSPCDISQWSQPGIYTPLYNMGQMYRYLNQVFLTYLFLAMACSLVLEDHGSPYSPVPEVQSQYLSRELYRQLAGLRLWAWFWTPERSRTHHFCCLHGWLWYGSPVQYVFLYRSFWALWQWCGLDVPAWQEIGGLTQYSCCHILTFATKSSLAGVLTSKSTTSPTMALVSDID